MPEALVPENWNINSGSRLLASVDNEPLTDAAPTRSTIVATRLVNDLVVDIVCDKGCSAVIRPLPDADNAEVKGKPSDVLAIAAGGGAERGRYVDISAPQAEITVTKTEPGDMAAYLLAIRGIAR